jgi:hypothetical protein
VVVIIVGSLLPRGGAKRKIEEEEEEEEREREREREREFDIVQRIEFSVILLCIYSSLSFSRTFFASDETADETE